MLDDSPAAELDEYRHAGLTASLQSEQQPFMSQHQQTGLPRTSAAGGGSSRRNKKHRGQQQQQQPYASNRVRGQLMGLSGTHIEISPAAGNNNIPVAHLQQFPVYQQQQHFTTAEPTYYHQQQPARPAYQQPQLSTMPRSDRQMLPIPRPPPGPPPPLPQSEYESRDSFVSSGNGENHYSVAMIEPEQLQLATNSMLTYGNRRNNQQLQQQQQRQLFTPPGATAYGSTAAGFEYDPAGATVNNSSFLMRHTGSAAAPQTNGSGSTIDNSCKPLCSDQLSDPLPPVKADRLPRRDKLDGCFVFIRRRRRLCFGLLVFLVVSLLAALVFCVVWSRHRQACLSDLQSRNSTMIFGGFDPSSPPTPLEDRRIYRVSLPGRGFWSAQLTCRRSVYAIVNVSLPFMKTVGLYIRRNNVPTLVHRDFFHRLENVQHKNSHPSAVVHFLTPGDWYLTLANDRVDSVALLLEVYRTDQELQLKSCLNECSHRGYCHGSACTCFQGFMGPDCSIADALEICSGNGYLDRGVCRCTAQWKGAECEVPWSECFDPLCSGNGRCRAGRCECFQDFVGDRCQNVTCNPADCGGRGQCQADGRCRCFAGWTGADCGTKVEPRSGDCGASQRLQLVCGGRGRFVDGRCDCFDGFSGDNCEIESCPVPCQHGRCLNGQCQCEPGWWGVRCNLRACDPLCESGGRGVCVNGTCQCAKGWNGPACSVDGCPQSCSNRGNCRRRDGQSTSLESDGSAAPTDWHCVCLGINQWRGDACQFSIEKDCSDGLDNDGDGLVDCFDPDCCHQTDCSLAATCRGGAIAQQVLLSEPPLPALSSFEKRVKFLVGKESVQLGFTSASIDPMRMSVIMGRLFLPDGSPLIASRQEDSRNPSAGYSLSRPDGRFILVASAPGACGLVSVSLSRAYAPKQSLQVEIPLRGVPPGVFLNLGNIWLSPSDGGSSELGSSQSLSGSVGLSSSSQFPQVYPQKHQLDSGCSSLPILPTPSLQTSLHQLSSISKNGILLERQTINLRIPIPDSPFSLVYSSSRAAGFKELLPVKLLDDVVPPGLVEVFCQLSVGGSLQQRRFPPRPNLTHLFEWDRMDPFNRPLTGLVEARVSVGYRFSHCAQIVWQTRAALIPGAELIPSRLGQWSIDQVHAYDYEAGVLHLGDGSTEYLSQRPWAIDSIPAGGPASLLPGSQIRWSLAVAASGHVIFADPVARRLSILPPSSGDPPQTLLQLQSALYPGSTVFHLSNDPSSPSDRAAVYLSDPGRREILRVPLNLAPPTKLDLLENAAPRALTVDRNGALYYVDTYSIVRRTVASDGAARTEVVVHGNGGALAGLEPWPCSESYLPVSGRLPIRWPIDLACNPLDDSLYFIDDQSIFRLCPESGRVSLIVGRPPHCPMGASVKTSHVAVNRRLRSPRSIEFTAQGELLIAQADGLWVLRSDGRLQAFPVADYPGPASPESVSDIAVGPLGRIYLAASTGAGPTVLKLRPDLPILTDSAYRVLSNDASQVFTFNSEGKHLTTEDAVTGAVKYRFDHSSYDTSPVAPVLRIRLGNASIELRNEYHNASIRSPSGRECLLEYSDLGQARVINCQGAARYAFEYERRGGGVTSMTLPGGGQWLFRYNDAGRLSETVEPTGLVDGLPIEVTVQGVRVERRKASVEFDASGSRRTESSGLMAKSLTPLQSVTVENEPNGDRNLLSQLTCSNCSIEFRTVIGNADSGRKWQRIVRLGSNRVGTALMHQAEWLYSANQMKLMVNSRAVLTVTFSRNPDGILSALYFGYNLNSGASSPAPQLLFSIAYNSAGKPVSVVPNSQLAFFRPVYFKYTERSQLSEMRWADKPRTASESTVREGWLQRQYDRAGRLVTESRNFSSASVASLDDLAVYRFGYLDNSSMPGHISDPVGQAYRFERDTSTAGLGRLVTPTSVSRLRVHSALSSTRLLYWSWIDTARALIFEYNTDGDLVRLLHPSRERRLELNYRQDGQPSEWSSYDGDNYNVRTKLNYLHESRLLVSMTTKHSSAACSVAQRFSYAAQLLPVEETIEFDAACSLASVIHRPVYHRHQLFAASILTSIADQIVTLNMTRHQTRGYATRIWSSGPSAYTVTRSEHSIELRDSNSTLKINFDSLGRLVDTMLHVDSARVFVLSVHGYSMGRVQELAHRIGKDDDSVFTNVAFVRDLRSRVTQVVRNVRGRSVDREEIEYGSNGRYARRVVGNRTYAYAYDLRGLPTSVGTAEYLFDSDGFLARRRNHRSVGSVESFKFDATGKLLTAHCVIGATDCYKIRYIYDGRQRLVARQDLLTPHLDLQFLYADPLQTDRITHAYYPRQKQLLTFIYEDRAGRLVAVDQKLHGGAVGSRRYYVACDRLGSPLAVFNATGDTVLRQDYSHTGRTLPTTVDRLPFRFPFGFLGGVRDPDTELVWLQGRSSNQQRRVYDPVSGLWAALDYLDLFDRLARAQQPAGPSPQLVDTYAFDPWLDNSEDDVYNPDTVGRPEFWLRTFNLDLRHLLAEDALEAIKASVPSSGSVWPLASMVTSSVLTEALETEMQAFQQEISRGSSSPDFGSRLVINATRRGALPQGYVASLVSHPSFPERLLRIVRDGATAQEPRASSFNNTLLRGCATQRDDDRWICQFRRDSSSSAAQSPIQLDGELETFRLTD